MLPLTPVSVLCLTQVISWGTLYYAFSILLGPIAASHGWGLPGITGAFSVCLLASGLAAYPAGRALQRHGGHIVMAAGSALAALAFTVVSLAPSVPVFYLGWALAGVAMSATLYDAAFSTLAALYESGLKRAVTSVTLAGGFASTVFWPLTERLSVWVGWRETLWLYAAIHLALCLPLHYFGLRRPAHAPLPPLAVPPPFPITPRFLTLAAAFTCNAIVFSAISVHLVPLLQDHGASPQRAAWLAAAAGPLQVAGRFVEFTFGARWRSIHTGTVALALLLPALACLLPAGQSTPLLLTAVGLYGISNGVMTIVRGVSIAELFGRDNYAKASGALAAPITLARALGPFLASLLLAYPARYTGVLAALLLIAALSFALFLIAMRPPTSAASHT